jgi:hypothetical protein
MAEQLRQRSFVACYAGSQETTQDGSSQRLGDSLKPPALVVDSVTRTGSKSRHAANTIFVEIKMKTKTWAVTLALAVLAGCKIQINVPENGRVTTESGNYTCESGQTCNVEVVDTLFNETFITEPNEDYFFEGWRGGPFYLCGWAGSACSLVTSFFEGSEPLLAILESDQEWLIEPQFVSYTLLGPNGYVSIEGVVDVKNVAYSKPEGAVSIDANNDGLEDLLMGPSNYHVEPELALALFINQGGGRYVENAAGVIDEVPLIGYINHPTLVADFNGDGADDAFLVDQGLEIGAPPFAGNQPKLLLSDGSGGLINASESHLPPMETEFHHSASVGDVDRDGDLDILVVTLSELRTYILVNDGFGSFALRTEGLPQQIVSEEANWDAGAISFAYVNDDELLDIVFGAYHNAPELEVRVTLQRQNGSFEEVQRIKLETPPFGRAGIDLILAEDLDGDGDDDLIGKIDESSLPGQEDSAVGDIGLFALRNDNGVFKEVTELWLGGSLASEILPDTNIAGLYLQDINGDQHLDLLFAQSIALNQLGQHLFLNDGRGRFSPTPAITIDSDLQISPAWYTDYDADGDTDIVGMYPDVNEVDGEYLSFGYEIIVLERSE